MFLIPNLLINQSSCLAYQYNIGRDYIFLQLFNKINFQSYAIKLSRSFFQLLHYKNKQIFCILNFVNLKTLFRLLSSKSKDLLKGFFLELDIKGLGYYIFLKKGYLILDLNYSHFIGVNVPISLLIKKFKTKMVIFGFNREILVNFAHLVLQLKRIDIYKGKGLFIRGAKFKLKEIKKK